jgi:alginate O-acetyltransferase complex protein AlgI
MLFNSIPFLIFFPVVTLLYFRLSTIRSRAVLLLLASCVFYAFFVPRYLAILAFTIVIDYFAGILIAGATRHRRPFLLASLVANIGVLAVFKYYGFLTGNLTALGQSLGTPFQFPALDIVLPIGLSFHTFQAMSYTIEVYRGNQPPERDFVTYALYVMFYPQLVAGPIERPQNLLPQFHVKHRFDYAQAASGLRRMAWGMFKKVVVADRLGAGVDAVFDNASQYHGLALCAAVLMFAFQIYLDFSAYSDIALGAARVMGFTLMENFRTPYFSRSISEFWRRWHVSLSTWFKDYVYVPLGGSRTSRVRHYRNLMIVFMLSGLWHGADWTYVVWGALHGGYLVVGHAPAGARARLRQALGFDPSSRVVGAAAMVSTFALVVAAWIFFRARTFDGARYIVSHLGTGLAGDVVDFVRSRGRTFPVPGLPARMALVALVLLVEWFWRTWNDLDRAVSSLRLPVRFAFYAVVVYGTIFGSGTGATQQFIYFQF